MQGLDIYAVLKRIGATHLHHANSVITSCTFLEQAGLLSRGFVEQNNLAQTSQPMSDEIDKRYNIWDCIFLDHVDIHARAGRKKAPNHYGPALFVFHIDILLGLPPSTEVFVTKMNPIYWRDDQLDSDRWFQSPQELVSEFRYGDFDKMLVIHTPTGKLDFPSRLAHIMLDDPKRQVTSGNAAYAHAESRLKTAAATGGVTVTIERRECQSDCICVKNYAKYPPHKMESFFG
jgi:hypothetical protein